MGKKDARTEILVTSCTTEPGLVVGSFFNGLEVPALSSFDLYQHTLNPDKFALHGVNDTLEYSGSTEAGENDYVVAFYDKKLRAVQLCKASLVPVAVTSKEHRVHKGPRVRLRGMLGYEQKNMLGKEFGTKNARAKITSMDRNRIDANKLEGIEADIVDSVATVTDAVPGSDTAADSATASVAPAANALATNAEDVYTLHSIVPENEWKWVRVNALMDEPDTERRFELLPYDKSAYVGRKLLRYISSGNCRKVQMLYYAALLFGVYAHRRVNTKVALMERLNNCPLETLVDGVLDRFTTARASRIGRTKDQSFIIEPFHEDKLLCYLLALLLHIDDFVVEINPLASELNMKPTRLIRLFRALGASVKPVKTGMAEALGLLKRDAATYKVAVLKVPFTPPEMVLKRMR